MTERIESTPPTAPRRLIESEGELGLLLKDATSSSDRSTDESEAFAGVLRRHERRRVRAQWVTGVGVCGVILAGWGLLAQPSSLELRAESSQFLLKSSRRAASAQPAETPRPGSVSALGHETRTLDSSGGAKRPATNLPPVSHQEAERSSLTQESCQALTRANRFEEALKCHEAEGAGTGISAELAWLEQARISQRALQDDERALRTLDEYLKLFPKGALVQEAQLSRLDLLVSTGRTELAVTTIDKLLGSKQASERTTELTKLRAKLTSGKPD